MTIAGATLTLTQAGSGYAAPDEATTVLSPTSILDKPSGLAVDARGNVYIADAGDNAVKEWNVSTQTLTTLVSSGLNQPQGVAVDAAGNVYIADAGDDAIKEWDVSTHTLTTLVSSGLDQPHSVAVDAAGNLYIVDFAIHVWNAATHTLSTVTDPVAGDSEVRREWR